MTTITYERLPTSPGDKEVILVPHLDPPCRELAAALGVAIGIEHDFGADPGPAVDAIIARLSGPIEFEET